jgi:hypothetical protein
MRFSHLQSRSDRIAARTAFPTVEVARIPDLHPVLIRGEELGESHSLLALASDLLGLTVERLYRVRYLHRGTHPVRTAIDLLLFFQLSLGVSAPSVTDSS